jgi:hypothetical protein
LANVIEIAGPKSAHTAAAWVKKNPPIGKVVVVPASVVVVVDNVVEVVDDDAVVVVDFSVVVVAFMVVVVSCGGFIVVVG